VQATERNLSLAAIALGVAVIAGSIWSLGVSHLVGLTWSRPRPPLIAESDLPVEPIVREDDCRFFDNGDYVCAGPVSAPRCGIAAVDVEYQTAMAIVSGELAWDDEPELIDALAIEDTEIVDGIGRTTLDLAFSFERKPAPVTIDLSDVGVTISGKPFCEFELELAKTSKLVQVLGPKRGQTSVPILLVHCHWPG
jgi:hypothetical protein